MHGTRGVGGADGRSLSVGPARHFRTRVVPPDRATPTRLSGRATTSPITEGCGQRRTPCIGSKKTIRFVTFARLLTRVAIRSCH